MGLTTAAHPIWCDPDACEVDPDLPLSGAFHHSADLTFDANPTPANPQGERIVAGLSQAAAAWETPTFLNLLIGGQLTQLELSQAAAWLLQLQQFATNPTH